MIPGTNKEIGDFGERCAMHYLRRRGYTVKERNWFSDRYEIDIIATTLRDIVFVEVKTRSYTAQDIDTCKNLLQSMKDLNLPAYLPTDTPADGLSPADLYQQLKEAILNM